MWYQERNISPGILKGRTKGSCYISQINFDLMKFDQKIINVRTSLK